MVAVVDVGVAATPLIQDCAKAEGATRKTKRRGTDTARTRINLHMAQYRNDPQPEEPGGALHPFLKNLSKSCSSIIGRAERYVTRDVLVIGTLNLRIFREWEVRPRSESALRSDCLDRNSPIFPSLIQKLSSCPQGTFNFNPARLCLMKIKVIAILFIVVVCCANSKAAPLLQEDAAAQPNAGKSLPDSFVSVLAEVKAKTKIPVLLPTELPAPFNGAKHAIVAKATAGGYAMELYYDLEMGDAGFAATFAAQNNSHYSLRELSNVREVKLAAGITGFF